MIKRILFGLAETIYTPVAFERAVTLAQTYDAEVTGVTVLDSRRVPVDEQASPPESMRHRGDVPEIAKAVKETSRTYFRRPRLLSSAKRKH